MKLIVALLREDATTHVVAALAEARRYVSTGADSVFRQYRRQSEERINKCGVWPPKTY